VLFKILKLIPRQVKRYHFFLLLIILLTISVDKYVLTRFKEIMRFCEWINLSYTRKYGKIYKCVCVSNTPCDQQLLFRSKKASRSWTYVDRCLKCMELFLIAYTCFHFYFGKICWTRRNKQQHCMSILHY
jgi:hypothetical protein